MRALQKELDDLQRDKERDNRREMEDGEEMVVLRTWCERLENERASGPKGVCVLFIHHFPMSILIILFVFLWSLFPSLAAGYYRPALS